MCWSLLVKEGQKYEYSGDFQPFTEEEWEKYPFANEEKLKWFRDAKLGLFFHVGISCMGKVDIGWSRHTHKLPDPGVGPIADEVYDGWAKEIRMEDFSADEWIDLAIAGGFKYVVIITKHHDGFNMWDTAYSDYKITNSPMARDYLGELIDACHRKNMPVGLYYSQRDWTHPDYEPVDVNDSVQIPDTLCYMTKDGKPSHAGKNHHKYISYMHNSVLELMEKYGKIDILWWDSAWWGGMYKADMWDSKTIEEKVRAKQPDIIINNRASLPGDFDTPEGRIGFVQRNRAWETCMPLGNEWAWTGNGIKPFKVVLDQFIHAVCGDGNYLLSIGCMPNGKIAPEETESMLKLGDWLKKYGHTVYGTRSGPWNPSVFGGSVYKDDNIYVHIVSRPESGKVILPLEDNAVKSVECLTGENVKTEITDSNLIITVPESDFTDIILSIKTDAPVKVKTEGVNVVE